jgi:lipoprotein-releasing system permease protein
MQNVILFIATRYFIAKKNINAVNTITFIAVVAISVATASMFIILSTFSGLEKFNHATSKSQKSDIEITPIKGKKLAEIENLVSVIKNHNAINSFSKTINEKAYVTYGDKNDIIKLKAIDFNYHKVLPLDSLISYGNYFDFDNTNQALVGSEVTNNLSILVDAPEQMKIYLPKKGDGLITSEEEAFNTIFFSPIGILDYSDLSQNTIFIPLEKGQSLLNLSNKDAYSIEIKINTNFELEEVKKSISQKLPNGLYQIKTRYEQDATLLKVLNTEKLMIYLIFSLVLFITTFNLSGAVLILILDKKSHIHILSSMGLSRVNTRKIFFYIGLIITSFGLIFGLLLGSIFAFLQKHFGLIMANAYVPFPIEFVFENYLFILILVFFLGTIASFIVSNRVYSKK